MVSRVTTVCFHGIEVSAIDVQVQVSSGLPAFSLVGLPDKAVTESRERVRSALYAMGLALPPKRILVNLAPADVQKEGSHYDLPISLALLAALGAVPHDILEEYVVLGELALDGGITAVTGCLSAAVHALSLGKGLICPAACGGEAAWGGGIRVLAPHNLIQLVNHFKGTQVLSSPEPKLQEASRQKINLKDIKGQETGKRALEIAAAGGHNLVMIGPPGSGKSMLAARLSTILPPLEAHEALEVSMIHSLAGRLEEGRLIRQRPFRDPHHSASMPALIGGGAKAQPGEISLAHHGVLFLDELPEFSRQALEALRQPLETGKAVIARARAHVTYPAQFQLVAAMNPCRCGYLEDVDKACRRAPLCGQDYQRKISGPLLDRIDLQVDVPAIKIQDLQGEPSGETSAEVFKRVEQARAFQKERMKVLLPLEKAVTNASIESHLLMAFVALDPEAQALVNDAFEKLKFSARSYHRILRVARTVADLDRSEQVKKDHITEVLSYRYAPLGIDKG